jgi:glucosamine 6-phosphate synthetase-like amidotransferase/phosphosugar isomerase protein
MYAQIQSQPAELERVLAAPEPVGEAAGRLSAARRVFCVGIGTSTNAANAAVAMLRAAGLDALASSSFDFVTDLPALRADDAALVFSHSGRKQFTRQAMGLLHEAGVPVVWIAGQDADGDEAATMLCTVPRETSSAFTVSHTTAMLMAARVSEAIAPGAVGVLASVPQAVDEALGTEEQVAGLAAAWRDRGMRCRGYAAEQFLHGPQAQVQPDGDAFTVFAGPGAALDRTRTVAQFALDVGAPCAWISPEAGPDGAVHIELPQVSEPLAPILEVVPGQLLAACLAAERDVDADNFRLDDQPFKRAFDRYSL